MQLACWTIETGLAAFLVTFECWSIFVCGHDLLVWSSVRLSTKRSTRMRLIRLVTAQGCPTIVVSRGEIQIGWPVYVLARLIVGRAGLLLETLVISWIQTGGQLVHLRLAWTAAASAKECLISKGVMPAMHTGADCGQVGQRQLLDQR